MGTYAACATAAVTLGYAPLFTTATNPLTTPGQSSTTSLDKAAILLSALCLIHCLAIPVALLLGTATSQWLLATETQVHWMLLALAIPLSVFALWNGYKKHNAVSILYLGGTGLLLMTIGVSHILSEEFEVVLTAIGVSLVLAAHVKNLLLNHRHDPVQRHDPS
jgi:hypothetical protein